MMEVVSLFKIVAIIILIVIFVAITVLFFLILRRYTDAFEDLEWLFF